MKEVDAPPPLDATPGTPEELRAVLHALGREAPGRATVERAARGLGPYLDAAPGLSLPAVEVARSGGRLLAARALAALLALGGSAYLVQRAWPHESEVPHEAAVRSVAASPFAVAPSEERTYEAAAPAVPEPATEPALTRGERRERRHRHHSRHRREVAVTADVTTAETYQGSTVASTVEDHAVVTAERQASLAERADEAPPSEEEPARKLAEPPPDEFALLWRARERIRRDPAAALALLDTHAGRFANGQLAPEREVLAVEALRQLGRTEEAEARLRSFRAQYPGSIHLRRLQKGH
jgi:hypothetical protein